MHAGGFYFCRLEGTSSSCVSFWPLVFLCRFVNLITPKWGFIVTSLILRILEGIGSTLFVIATMGLFPVLFPDYIGILIVRGMHHTALQEHCMYVCMSSQGLFELAAGLGYVIGYIIGGVLYEVCDLWGALGVHERCTYFANCKVRTCNPNLQSLQRTKWLASN